MKRSTISKTSAIFAVLTIMCVLSMARDSIAQEKTNDQSKQSPGQGPRAVIFVMPSALAAPGSADNSQVVVDSAHNGKEPQVAKIYQELQHREECQQFSANMNKDKADYFLLLQHGGGKGNRWVVSNRDGSVVASGQSIFLGNSVRDACRAVDKDWRKHGTEERSSR